MADARVTQPSFASGEISPELFGRQDLAKYQVGCRLLQNMYVHAYGGVSNRPGLRFVTEVKDSTKHVRLQKFEAALDEAFLVEAGDLYFRYIFEGAYVTSGGLPVETVTPYGQTKIDDLYLEQSNDVATITHEEFAPRELRRTAPTVWTLSSALTFQPATAAPTGVAAAATQGYTGYGGDKLPQPQTYKVAAVGANGEESLPSAAATSGNNVLGYEQNYNTITWNAVAGAIEYIVYKRENGVYGFIGRTTDLTFRDTNFAPEFADGPQAGSNPFNAASDYPAIVSFVQQRRVFAATLNQPQTIFMTQSGNFNNMGVSTPAKDDDAVEFTLAAQKKQDIFHVVALEKGMIVFTRSGEWRVTGREGDVITPSSILPEPQSYYGSTSSLKPIIAGQNLLFVPRNEGGVLEMEYSISIDRYKANDLALLSKHLFRNRTIVAWSYAAIPDGIIWCVMDDGSLLSLTYLKEHDVWGWGRHQTKGNFLDVVSIPESGNDTPYFLIERRIGGAWKKYIEYLPQRDFVDVQDCFFVDSGLSFDNPQDVTAVAFGATTVLTVTAHGYTNGAEIDLAGLKWADVEGENETDISGRYLVANATANTFEIRDLQNAAVNTSAFASGYYYDLTAVARNTTLTVSGLSHLNGRAVVALCDGNVIDGLTVSAGAVTFERRHARIHVGLAYSSIFYSLDIINPQADANGIRKGTPAAFVRVERSRGFAIGATPETVVEDQPRSYEDYGDPASLKTEKMDVDIWGDWGEENTVAVVQNYPLPLSILSVTTEIVYGG